ncbi:hypothetical protein SAZ11_52510 [Streptomyces sp. FXJ1.4098]|nr:hypothetical protein [Streptomyces sp. FXJ1.4098]
MRAAVARAGVRLIVTAREPLAAATAASSAGFSARTVGPLPVPFDCSALDLDGMCRIPSVRLYVASLHALNPAFRVQHDNQEAVARTCAELRGIPGALVLAARIAALEGPEVLWAALDGRFDPGPEAPRGPVATAAASRGCSTRTAARPPPRPRRARRPRTRTRPYGRGATPNWTTPNAACSPAPGSSAAGPGPRR